MKLLKKLFKGKSVKENYCDSIVSDKPVEIINIAQDHIIDMQNNIKAMQEGVSEMADINTERLTLIQGMNEIIHELKELKKDKTVGGVN